MSRYLYPMKLQPAIIYPDTEPVIGEADDADERSFKALPVICELLMQQLADGKIAKPNMFVNLLGNAFVGAPYNAVVLDQDIYTFKAEWDTMLVGEGSQVLAFNVPQLKDILAAEIDYVEAHGYPLLDPSDPSSTSDAALQSAATDMLKAYGAAGVPGLHGLGDGAPSAADQRAASAAAASVGPQTVPPGPSHYNDGFMQVFQQLSPYMDIGFKAISNLVSGAAALGSQGTSVASAFATSTQSIAQALGYASVQDMTLMSAALSMSFQALVNMGMTIIQCAGAWTAMKNQLRALVKAAGQIQTSFHELAQQITAATAASRTNTDQAMTEFRLVMAEMIARVLRGEMVVGLVNCDASGNLLLTFGVDPSLLGKTGTPDATGLTSATGTASPVQKAAAVGAGLWLLGQIAQSLAGRAVRR